MINLKCKNCDECQSRVGWIGLCVSVLVGSFTIFIGLINGSKALIATSLCSGIDISTALIVILGIKISNKNIDLKHPYGHGKIEFVVIGWVSILLIISAAILFFSSIKCIVQHEKGPDQWLTLAAALVAAGINEVKHRFSKCVGTQMNSPAILTHAEHARVDAISAAAVVIGVICARMNLHIVDPLIAIFEVGHIFRASFKMFWNSIENLMDVSVPENTKIMIRKIVNEVDGVEEINFIKARQMGQEIWIDLSIFLDPDIVVLDGKNIADNIKMYIIDKMDHIGNVQVQFRAKIV